MASGKDFMGKCFAKDSRKLWTVEMLLSHPFVFYYDTVLVEDKEELFWWITISKKQFSFPILGFNGSVYCTKKLLKIQSYPNQSSLAYQTGPNCVKKHATVPWCVSLLIQDIWHLNSLCESLQFHHIFKEANFTANSLLGMGHKLSTSRLWKPGLPLSFSNALFFNFFGFAYPRGFAL
ncbi:hypothetical protein GBA52_015275 [Prunus armeniaca]|nr:hypothetical protein GBA52_015275 [Prunus armeniaca]